MAKRLGLKYLIFAAGLILQATEAHSSNGDCELHVWTTSNYGGIFFHAANGRLTGSGVEFDLVKTPVQKAAEKAQAELNADDQSKAISAVLENSNKFHNYKIIIHNQFSEDQAKKYYNLMDKSIGFGGRDYESTSQCYREMHVAYITMFRTHLSKMLMTGFIIREFPSDPKADAVRIFHSKPERGQERVGVSSFDFSTASPSALESGALFDSFEKAFEKFLDRIK
jgi:hypothetical protein